MAKKKSSERPGGVPTEAGKRRLSKTTLDKIYDSRRAGALGRGGTSGRAKLAKLKKKQAKGSGNQTGLKSPVKSTLTRTVKSRKKK